MAFTEEEKQILGGFIGFALQNNQQAQVIETFAQLVDLLLEALPNLSPQSQAVANFILTNVKQYVQMQVLQIPQAQAVEASAQVQIAANAAQVSLLTALTEKFPE